MIEASVGLRFCRSFGSPRLTGSLPHQFNLIDSASRERPSPQNGSGRTVSIAGSFFCFCLGAGVCRGGASPSHSLEYSIASQRAPHPGARPTGCIASFHHICYRLDDGPPVRVRIRPASTDGDDLRREPPEGRKADPCEPTLARNRACVSTSTWSMRTARSCSHTPASSGSRASCRSARTRVTVRDAHRDQEQEPGVPGGEARSRGGLGPVTVKCLEASS